MILPVVVIIAEDNHSNIVIHITMITTVKCK